MASEAQILANRRNAQKSTGPRTEAGKARSRQNALKHGLTGAGVVQPASEVPKITQRLEDWRPTFAPANAHQEWLLGQAVLQSVRLERCGEMELAQRGVAAQRAEVLWDEDRGLAVEQLAQRLAVRPALIVAELKRTRQGCDWLLARWRALERALAARGAWTDAERNRALDLLGVRLEERTLVDDPLPENDAQALKARLAREIEGLEALKSEALDHLDETERELAQAGLSFDMSLPARLLRRYESACRRALEWALAELRKGRRGAPGAATEPAPASPARPPLATPAALRNLEALVTAARAEHRPASGSSLPTPAPAPAPAGPSVLRPLSAEELPLDELLASSPRREPADPLSLLTAARGSRKERRALKRLQRPGK